MVDGRRNPAAQEKIDGIVTVAFEIRGEPDRCKAEYGDGRDDDVFYCVAGESRKEFPALRFVKISFCSGIITVTK